MEWEELKGKMPEDRTKKNPLLSGSRGSRAGWKDC